MLEFHSTDIKPLCPVKTHAGCRLVSLGAIKSLQNRLCLVDLNVRKTGFPSMSLEKTNKNQDHGRKQYHHKSYNPPNLGSCASWVKCGKRFRKPCSVTDARAKAQKRVHPRRARGEQQQGQPRGTGGRELPSQHATPCRRARAPRQSHIAPSCPCSGLNRFTLV